MHLSSSLADAAMSPRTERDARLERLIRAGEAFYAARSRYHAYEGDDSSEEERLCEICSQARLAFAQACERFFVNDEARLA
jgi:hypothetical protein